MYTSSADQFDIELAQKRMLEILEEIDRICKANNIKYILDGGTMLGAIRHEGFIPWDNDLDIAMLRKDYELFIAACNDQLSTRFFLQTNQTEKNYPLNFAKMTMNDTVYKSKLFKDMNIHHGIYIDIFPIDNIYRPLKAIHCRISTIINSIRWCKLGLYDNKMKSIIYKPFTILPIETINRISEIIMQLFVNHKTKYVYKVCHPSKNKKIYEKKYHEEIIYVDFCNGKYPVPKDYDEFLIERYGDYMKYPPIEKQKPDHEIIEWDF